MRGYDSWHWEDSPTWTVKTTVVKRPIKVEEATDALKDIAYDCGTLEAAQRRAKEALAKQKESH